MPTNPKAKTKRSLGCLAIFWMLWTLLVGVFDLTICYKTFQQLRSLSFKPVVAVLDKSKVESKLGGGKGNSSKAVVEYHYSVDGKEYQSNRLEFLDTAFGPADAKSRLPKTAVGKELTAHFDPFSPEVSVLRKGFRFNDLIIPIFLLPFNAVSIVGMIFFLDWKLSKSRGYRSIHFGMRESGNETEFRFYSFSPLLASIVAAGAAGFVLTAFIVIPPQSWINLRIVIALILIISASSWAYLKSSRYYTELSINQFKNELAYGIFGSRVEGAGIIHNVPLVDSLSLKISETESSDSDGITSINYLLSLNTETEKLIDLHEYQYLEDAEQMAKWLSNFGLRFAEV